MSLKCFLVCSWLWLWFPLSLAMRGHLTSLDQSVVAPKQKHCGEAISWNPGFSVGWMCFSHWNPTKASLDFFLRETTGRCCVFSFPGWKFYPFSNHIFFGDFSGGLATTLSSEMPRYREIGRKDCDPVQMKHLNAIVRDVKQIPCEQWSKPTHSHFIILIGFLGIRDSYNGWL